MKKDYCEKPDFEVIMFETEESVMTTSVAPPPTDSEGWTTIIVKP